MALTGLPAGVTPSSATITGTSTVIQLGAVAGSAAASANVTVTGSGSGVTSQAQVVAVSVVPPSFTMSLSPATVSVVPTGPSAASTVTINRVGGFAGAVNLVLTGLPAGVTPSSATIGTAATTAVLSIAAAAGATQVTNATITVTGSGSGVANQAQTFSLTVQPAPQTVVTTNPSGRSIIVDGVTYTAPQTFTWAVGTSHTVNVASPQAGTAGVQYVYGSWSDGGAASHTVTGAATATTLTANFVTQYSLTTSVSPAGSGTILPASGWHNAGAVLNVGVSNQAGYAFSNFSGALTGGANPQSLTMDAPKTVTANFTTLPVTISVNPSTAVTLQPGQTQQFTATVGNTANTAVTWTLSGPGTLSGSGLYTAPWNVGYTQYPQVTATSVADPSKSASRGLTLNPPNPPTANMVGLAVSSAATTTYTIQTHANPGRIRYVTFWAQNGSGGIKCMVLYNQATNVLQIQGPLLDVNGDPTGGTGWVASGTVGSAATIMAGGPGGCWVNLGSSSASISGNTLTLNLNTYMDSGTSQFYILAEDYSGFTSGSVYGGYTNVYF